MIPSRKWKDIPLIRTWYTEFKNSYTLITTQPSFICFKILCVCVSVLTTVMSVHCVYVVSLEAKRRHWILLRLELQMVVSYSGSWGLDLGPPEEEPVLLTTKPSLQSPSTLKWIKNLNRHFSMEIHE